VIKNLIFKALLFIQKNSFLIFQFPANILQLFLPFVGAPALRRSALLRIVTNVNVVGAPRGASEIRTFSKQKSIKPLR
jgi:hypothetical protein